MVQYSTVLYNYGILLLLDFETIPYIPKVTMTLTSTSTLYILPLSYTAYATPKTHKTHTHPHRTNTATTTSSSTSSITSASTYHLHVLNTLKDTVLHSLHGREHPDPDVHRTLYTIELCYINPIISGTSSRNIIGSSTSVKQPSSASTSTSVSSSSSAESSQKRIHRINLSTTPQRIYYVTSPPAHTYTSTSMSTLVPPLVTSSSPTIQSFLHTLHHVTHHITVRYTAYIELNTYVLPLNGNQQQIRIGTLRIGSQVQYHVIILEVMNLGCFTMQDTKSMNSELLQYLSILSDLKELYDIELSDDTLHSILDDGKGNDMIKQYRLPAYYTPEYTALQCIYILSEAARFSR